MGTFILTFLVMALAVTGMALGVLCGRRPIAGSCGGLNALGGEGARCGSCSRPCSALVRRRAGPVRSDGDDDAGRRVPPEHVIGTIHAAREG